MHSGRVSACDADAAEESSDNLGDAAEAHAGNGLPLDSMPAIDPPDEMPRLV